MSNLEVAMKKLIWAGAILLLAGAAIATAMNKPSMNENAPPAAEKAAEKVEEKAKPDTKSPAAKVTEPTLDPVVYGNEDAPVVIEEFASLTCSHCAHFHSDILPEMKKEFLETGRVKLHWNSFIRNEQDLRATQLIYCQEDNTKRQQFVKAILQSQEQWAYSTDFVNNLRVMAQVGGVSNADFDACIADKSLEDKLIANREYAIGKGLDSTPFFAIGAESIKGARDIGMFRAAIEDAEKAKK
jgi:protein-disulfide isomerase